MDKWLKLENNIGKKLTTYIGDGYGNYLYDFNNFNSPFNDDFDKLYFQSANDDYYWLYCQMKVYKRTLKDRFERFKNYYIDGEISDFAEEELKEFKKKSFPISIASSHGLEASNSYYHEYTYFNHQLKRICKKEIFDQMQLTQNKKIEHLKELKERNKFDDIKIEKSEPKIVLADSDNSQAEKEPEPPGTNQNNSLNDFPEIFAGTGFQIFKMLDEKYKKDNKKLKTKYSNLYRFLDYKELLRCTQLEYIDFIQENYSVKLSKILPKTAKYEDIIQPLLMRHLIGQQ